METTIENKIQKTIEESKKNFEGSELLDKYEEASRKFDELVKKGIAKRRGNNLISITDLHLHKSIFNSTREENSNLLVTNL